MDEKPNYENGEGQSFNISKGFGANEGIYKKPDKQNQETKAIIESMGEAFVKGTIPDMDSARKILDSYVKSRPQNED